MDLSTTKLAVLFRPQKSTDASRANRVSHSEPSAYSEVLARFGEKVAGALSIGEASDLLLYTLRKALNLTCADLLLKETEGGDFVTLYSHPKQQSKAESRRIISQDNEVAKWLFTHNRALARDSIGTAHGPRVVVSRDQDELSGARWALFVPVVSRGELIGIVALGPAGAPFRTEQLRLVTTTARLAGIVIDNVKLYARAQSNANVDELTGLSNHRYLQQRINDEIARCARIGEVFTLLSIDLDLFNRCNDGHGHAYGDTVLQRVGGIIKSSIGSADIASRFGEDEFAVVLPGSRADHALEVAEKIRRAVESYVDPEGRGITCSIGVASWPTDGVMREQLISASHSALTAAKKTGRNRVCIASQLAPKQGDEPAEAGSSDVDLSTIYALAATVDAKDHYTYGHSRKVSQYAADIGAAYGLDEDRIKTIRTAGLLHDIGKIGVSDQVLGKPGKLDDAEWKLIRSHPTMGVSIIEHVNSLRDCVAAVQYHHERYDGSGYPFGLKGDDIPLDARILAVADSYDAMTSLRPYRNQLTKDEALEELIHCADTHFDPRVVSAFVRCMSQTKETLPTQASR